MMGLEIKMGQRAGTMSLCIPFNVIEPVIGKLATQSWLAYQRKATNQDQIQKMTSQLRAAAVKLRAFLAETSITVDDLMHLRPGDVIRTEKPTKAEIIIQVEGKNKYAGRMGQLKGARAIRITRLAEPNEPL